MGATASLHRQNVRWLRLAPRPTVLLVDDQRSEFKRRFAPTLLTLRAGKQAEAAGNEKHLWTQRGIALRSATSEATYRRWEKPDDDRLPDAYELMLLCAELECDASELVDPQALNPREVALARQVTRGRNRGLAEARQVAAKPGASPSKRRPRAAGGSPK
jgi:hypothetical protein